MSTVVFRHLDAPGPEAIRDVVADMLVRLDVTQDEIGARCLLKINGMSDELLPGRNTSPWMLDGTLAAVRLRFPRTEFIVADSDTAGFPQFNRACRVWGYDAIAQRHGVRICNLSHEPTVTVQTDNPICPTMQFPQLVMQVDSIINLPVLKTHVITGITCALKNHWGLLPRFRYQYHPWVCDVIAEINRQVRHTVCSLVDATVCIEGSGPKTGHPIVASVIMGSRDRVAVDALALRFMEMDPDLAPHVRLCEERGVGSCQVELEGDEFFTLHFQRPTARGDLVNACEARLRRLPLIGPLFYHPLIARTGAFFGFRYNKYVWMRVWGSRYAREIMQHPQYGPQFRNAA